MELALLALMISLLWFQLRSNSSFPEVPGIIEKIIRSAKAGAILFASIFEISISLPNAKRRIEKKRKQVIKYFSITSLVELIRIGSRSVSFRAKALSLNKSRKAKTNPLCESLKLCVKQVFLTDTPPPNVQYYRSKNISLNYNLPIQINKRTMKNIFLLLVSALFTLLMNGQQQPKYILLKPARVFDGEQMHSDWSILVMGNKITEAGSMKINMPAGTQVIELPGCTVLPGLIEGHSHLFLHPYNETSWDEQVLNESRAERTARAVTHANATLMAGFTTVRDLGTEGSMYDDVGLKTAIEKGVVPGPRMICATRAIVAKGTYGPKSPSPDVVLPQGAAEVSNVDEMMNEVRIQISKGADVIKIYADYRWGPNGEAKPTFSEEEIAAAVKIANSSGRLVTVHSVTPEGMMRAINAGVSSIEHGDNGTEEVFKLMKEKGIALCPTLAAGDAVLQYHGWKKGVDPEPRSITSKKKSFQAALQAGVTICMGGDVGVFAHGDNAREMEMMVDYGMKPLDVLRSATSINADVFGYADKIGRIKKGLFADIIAVEGDPSADIKNIRKIKLVIKEGFIYKNDK